MATMILYYYEHELIRKIKRKGNLTDHKFGNVLRFIDELAAKNYGGEFDRILHEIQIYSLEPKLKKKKISPFLDLVIKIEDKQFKLGLYDKRDLFPLSNARMPYLPNNVPF